MGAEYLTIEIPNGIPSGIRIYSRTGIIGTCFVIPRSEIGQMSNHGLLKKPGVYFLVGERDQSDLPVVYIGQTHNFVERIKEHNKNKSYWQDAIFITSETTHLNEAHYGYLENYCHMFASKNTAYNVRNATKPHKTNLNKQEEHTALNFFKTIKLYLEVIGHSFLEDIEEKTELFYLKYKGIKATGSFTGKELIVYIGSEYHSKETPSCTESAKKLRRKLIDEKVVVNNVFEKAYVFTSPSAAADAITGSPKNGWTEWKNSKGKTLDEVKRKNE